MNRTVVLVFLLILFSCLDTNAQQRPFKFSSLSVDNGLSHMATHGVIQDKHGYIWIATLLGLNRYDGRVVRKFYNTNVPRRNAFKNRIWNIALDERNRIWIDSEDGIQIFDPETEKYTDVGNVKHNSEFNPILALKGNLLALFEGNRPCLFRIQGNTVKAVPLNYPQGVRFTDMVPDDTGNIWLSSDKGIWLLDRSFRFRHFEVTDGSGVPVQQLHRIFFNRQDQLLVIAGTSVMLIKEQSRHLLSANQLSVLKLTPIQQIIIPGYPEIRDIIQDKHLDYWVSTDAGLFLLDRTLKLKQTIKAGSTFSNLTTNDLDKLFMDRSECLWVTTKERGIDVCDLNVKPFYLLRHSADPNSLSGDFISMVLEESASKVWIATTGSGLNSFDPQTLQFRHYTTKNGAAKLNHDNVHALALDNDRNLWIGTALGIQILNKRNNAFWQPAGYDKFPTHYVSTLAKDYYGNIWFGNYGELGSITRDKKNIYKVKLISGVSGHQIWASSKRPELLVSTMHGLLRLIIDSAGGVTRTYKYIAGNTPNSLSSDYAYAVRQQNDSTYWVGMIGGGLNRLFLKKDNNYTITSYGKRDGIFDDVETIELDRKGNIWMGGAGESGLESFNPLNKTLMHYDKNDGLQGNSFKIGASCSAKDGRLYFGGLDGLNYFYPDSIKVNHIEARPMFTDLLINNKKVVTGSQEAATLNNPLEKSISYTQILKLNYLQNDFMISFSAMHYANPLKCKYRYRLVGSDKEWKFTDGSNPTASYNNLDYGNYTLLLQASNNDGIWSSRQASLSITVTPPWWKSTLAKIIYLILFLSVLIGIYVYQARWYRLKREVSIRDLEQKKQEELYQQQLQINQQIQEKNTVLQEADEFKNKLVSMLAHDFRSPLATTISIAQLMRSNPGFTDEEMESFYGSIEKDANQMLESFDTILQWIRQQLSGYQLKTEPLEIRSLLDESAALFKDQMGLKKITFSNDVPEGLTAMADREMLQFVNRNLISNAIKFSPEGGTITAGSTQSNGEIIVSISDEGTGMSEKVLGKLFSVSTQVGSSTREGAGIALSMCRDFIQKLNGRIWAENKEPNGAILQYSLPILS